MKKVTKEGKYPSIISESDEWLSDEEVWLRMWEASKMSPATQIMSSATLADEGLEAFKLRFRNE